MNRLHQRLSQGEVLLLDGAIGTELQKMGVAMHDAAWCAIALKTHPETVRRLHEDYIRAGADIITTNTYSSARHNLELAGLGDQTRALNKQAVVLAREAIGNMAPDRPIYLAGSLSNFGAFPGQTGQVIPPAKELEASYREQAGILAEEGVDLLVLEMVRDIENGTPLLKAASSTGLPVWVGFSCRVDADGAVKLLDRKAEITLAQGMESLLAQDCSAVTVMHTPVEETTPALQVVFDHWKGPVGAYANSGYWVRPVHHSEDAISPEGYLAEARAWVQMGVQIIGGCCGVGREHIRKLRKGLPTHSPKMPAQMANSYPNPSPPDPPLASPSRTFEI